MNETSCNLPVPANRSPRVALQIAAFWLAISSAASAWAQLPPGYDWNLRSYDAGLRTAGPPLPAGFDVQLVADDGGLPDGAFGFSAGTAAVQFMWLQQFDRSAFPQMELQEIWVLFPSGPNMAVNAPIDLVVYLDADADPSNGATHLVTLPTVIQHADGATFSVYPLASPISIDGPGELLIGVVNRFVTSGVTSPTEPVALDRSASLGRSWVALWSGDPPLTPTLPPDLLMERIDVFVPGNFLIRGLGQVPVAAGTVVDVPTLGGTGLAVLALLLGAAGIALRRRATRRRTISGAPTLLGLVLLGAVLAAAPPVLAQGQLFGADTSTDDLIDIDVTTGMGTSIGDFMGFGAVEGLAYDPNTSALYGVDVTADVLISIDETTGEGTSIGSLGFNAAGAGLAFDPNSNILYLSSVGPAMLYTVDTSTGMATAVGATSVNLPSLAYDPNSDTLYAISGQTDSLYTVNTTTGASALVGALGVNTGGNGAAYDPVTDTLYFSNPLGDQLYTVNTTTGEATAVGGMGFGNVLGLTFAPPELLVPTFAKSFSPNPIFAGGVSTLSFTITNPNAAPVANLAYTDNLPAGVVVTTPANNNDGCAGTLTANAGAGTITFTGGTVGASTNCTIAVDVTAAASGTFDNSTGDLTSDAGNSGTASDSLTVDPLVNLTLTKMESTDPVTAGSGPGNLVYTITVGNTGPSVATGVALSEVLTLPAGVSIDSIVASGSTSYAPMNAANGTWTVGMLGVGGSETLTVTLTAAASTAPGMDVISDTVTVTNVDQSNAGATMASAATSVDTRADLVITKTDAPDPVLAGNNLTYTVTVMNNGPSDAQNVVVTDTLPMGVSSPTTAGSCAEGAAGVPTCTFGTIAAGASAQYTITVTVDPETRGTITNNASVASSTPEGNAGDESTSEDTLVNGEVDLTLQKTESSDPVMAGSGANNLTYTITVGNNGPSAATGLILSEALTLPAGVTITSITPSAGTSYAPPNAANGAWTVGTLGPSATATLTVVLSVGAATAPGTDVVSDTVTVTAPNESNVGVTQVSEATSVTAAADLVITKTDSPDPVLAGNNLTYTVTVMNNGPSDAQNVVVTDALPIGVSSPTTAGSCAEGAAGVPTCTFGTIAAGASAQYTITVTVDPETRGTITNNASVTSSTPEAGAGNEANNEDTQVNAQVELTLLKTESADPVTAGSGAGNLTYTITVGNNGPSAATGLTLSEALTLPAGVTIVSITPSAATVYAPPNAANGTWTVGTLGPGTTATLTVVLTVGAMTAAGTDVISDTVTVTVVNESNVGATQVSEATSVTEMAEPPTVTLVDSMADTGDGELAECEEAKVAVHQLRVSFNEAVQDPAGDTEPNDVTNAANYLLVAAGDQDFETTTCTGLSGNDVGIAIDGVSYNAPTRTATLSFLGGTRLADSLYRLLVCDSIVGLAGPALDGDNDGTAGGDFVRTFRVERESLLANGHFDCTIDAWTTVSARSSTGDPGRTPSQEIAYSSMDVDDSLVSGSLGVSNLNASTDFSIGQCVAVLPAISYHYESVVQLVTAPAEILTVTAACEYFASGDCMGASLDIDVNVTVLFDTADLWHSLDLFTTTPESTGSALCSVDLHTGSGASFSLFVDEIRLTSRIFTDGFESGTTAAWSATVP